MLTEPSSTGPEVMPQLSGDHSAPMGTPLSPTEAMDAVDVTIEAMDVDGTAAGPAASAEADAQNAEHSALETHPGAEEGGAWL